MVELEVSLTAERDYQDLIDRLLGLDFNRDQNTGEQVPHVLHLDTDAKAAWVAFYNSWGTEQAATEGEMAAALSKLEGCAARVAMLHHIVSSVSAGEDDLLMVRRESIEAGITMVRWFAGEARRIYAMLSESPGDSDRRRLIEWIQSRGGRTAAKELQRSNSRRYPDADAAQVALDDLVAAGVGDWRIRPAGTRGGRPTRDFVLFQVSDETDETDETTRTDGRGTDATPDQTSDDTQVPF